MGVERTPSLGDASLVLKWASRHHTETEQDQTNDQPMRARKRAWTPPRLEDVVSNARVRGRAERTPHGTQCKW